MSHFYGRRSFVGEEGRGHMREVSVPGLIGDRRAVAAQVGRGG